MFIVVVIKTFIILCLSIYKNYCFFDGVCLSYFPCLLGNLALCCAFSNLRTDKWRKCKEKSY
jgi:hypothetical protein